MITGDVTKEVDRGEIAGAGVEGRIHNAEAAMRVWVACWQVAWRQFFSFSAGPELDLSLSRIGCHGLEVRAELLNQSEMCVFVEQPRLHQFCLRLS